jgi:hypothetical protein
VQYLKNNNRNFAPQPPRHLLRGWDRAPVSAHAPRLQGKKVWKKPVSKHVGADDEERAEEAQRELRREGAGQRKKLRVLGARENIRDAAWETVSQGHNNDNNGMLFNIGIGIASLGG